jgi:hypothetical protein
MTMPSSLIVPVAEVQKVREHPNASLLCIAEVLGWQCVVPMQEDPDGTIVRQFVKGALDERGKRVPYEPETTKYPEPVEVEEVRFSPVYTKGDVIVYFPPDSMLPREWADRFGVTGYLSFKSDDPDFGRVRCARLRGEPSFGVVVDLPEGVDWKPGDNVADYYGAKKYEPPVRPDSGDMDCEHALFTKYTDIENLRNFPQVFEEGEEVVVTEKIHGCFHADTKVMLSNGEEIPISELSVDDFVLAYDGDEFVPKKVKGVVRRGCVDGQKWSKLTFSNGRSVVCTDDHKLLTGRGWVAAGEILPTDELVGVF